MSIYYRIYSGAADTYCSRQSTNYSLANDSTTSTVANVGAVSGFVRNQFVTPNYVCAQTFFVFDTSAVPAGSGTGTINTRIATFGGNVDSDTIRFREASSTTVGINGAALSALTLVADPGTYPTATGAYQATLSDVSSIPRSATFNVVMHSVGQENNTTPTGINSVGPYLSEQTGTTNDPFLQIVVGTGWEFVGVSAVAEATATSLSLTMAPGVADGDLLVACIALRTTSTTSLSNTGWTLVSEQKTNNTLTNSTSAIASGCMFYQIRAGATDVSFALPAGISVAMGRIIAYRNVNTSSPKDTQTSFTTAVNITAVSGTGLTTTQDDDLIVAMAAGGQDGTWSAFNATDPGTSSGTGSSVTAAPAPGIWQERADSLTASGADTSLAIFDAVKTTTGATGNLTATASLGAGQVVIAGAFKIAAAVPTGTGTLTAQASDTDGLGASSSAGSGTPASQASAVAGVGTAGSAGVSGDGAIVAQSSAAAGVGVSTWISIGALAAQSSAASGTGNVSTAEATGTGALAAQSSDADGAGTISGVPDAWNSADKSTNITLSNSDKTATLTAAVTSGVRSTTKYLNGTETNKFYVEFLLSNVVGTISNQVGLREVSAALNGSAGSTFQCASNSGSILTGNATIIGNIGGSPLADNDVVCMAWSPSTERGWFRKNNGLWNNDAAADPATNTNGLNISVLNNTDHALFFLIASTGNGASTTIRTEAADLTYSAPSGFVSWMGEALSTPEATGTGALAAQDAAVAGAGLSISDGNGAVVADAAAVGGAGVSSSTGTGNAVAEPAAVAGTGITAAANSGALVAESVAVAGDGVSGSICSGALQVGAASIVGAGQSVSTGIGALACSPVTIEGVGVVLEEGVAVGTGELLAGAATISGEGEVSGEVAPPIDVGGGFYPYPQPLRPVPVVGYGYGILPQIKGEAHGVVATAGRSIGTLPRFAGQADAASGAAGSSSAHLTVKAAASGNTVARGNGSGMIVKFQGTAVGRHDDDEAAIVAWLLAA